MPKAEEPRHVMVINDTPQILALFDELLGEAGYRVTTDRFTVESDRLLADVKERAPDLIILDLVIGNEGLGWQFLQMLKMDRDTREMPIVICTAAVRQVQELQSHLDEMGVAVVLKPFDIDHLLTVVAGRLADQLAERPAEPGDKNS
jgi:CheY-like chemotaxis protein